MTPFKFIYTNHRGETAERTAIPLGVRFGSTQWHPEPQWLLRAFDLEKGAEREFAMGDISDALVTRADDPEADGTDLAHPAWWRGNDRGTEAVVEIVNKIMDGGDKGAGTFGYEPLNKLRLRLIQARQLVLDARADNSRKPPFRFVRYVDGQERAQGIMIDGPEDLTLGQATVRALALLRAQHPNDASRTVLVLDRTVPHEPAKSSPEAAASDAALREDTAPKVATPEGMTKLLLMAKGLGAFTAIGTEADMKALTTMLGAHERSMDSLKQWEDEVRSFLDQCPWTVRHCEGGGPEDLHGSMAITMTKMQGLLRDVAQAVKMLDAAREAAREYVGPGEVNALRDLEKAARDCLPRGTIPVNREPLEGKA